MRLFPSGQTRFSPDETALLSLPSGKNHDIPDGRTLRLAHQNHFGSQCATGRVYWHRLAKVELKKSHFGKQSLTECALRRPPCQSELAEGPVRRRGVEDVSGWVQKQKKHLHFCKCFFLVEIKRCELLTLCLQSRCSTN